MAHTTEASSPAPSPSNLREHDGPWTEQDFLHLPDGTGRIELIDGSLLISPVSSERDTTVAARVRQTLEQAVPETLAVTGPLRLRVAPGRIVWPDLVVGRPVDPAIDVVDAAEVLLVVDVTSRGALVDQIVMPQLYADGGIPYYLRIDRNLPVALAHMLVAGRHREFAAAGRGETLTLEDPFRLALEVDALIAEESAA